MNLDGALIVAEETARREARLVFSSSAAVYGHQPPGNIPESAIAAPLSPYGEQKLAVEKALLASGSHSVILRFFNVYGPGQRESSPYSGVITLFARQALLQQPLVIYGDGSQTRDFVFVDDVACAAVLAGLNAADKAVINVGSGRAIEIRALSELIGNVCPFPCEIEFRPERAGEIRFSTASIRLASDLGFTPATGLRFGVNAVLQDLGQLTPASPLRIV